MSDNRTPPGPLPVVLVTGLSGGGKASVLRALEDLGFEAVDNPPLDLIETLALRRAGAECPIGLRKSRRWQDGEKHGKRLRQRAPESGLG